MDAKLIANGPPPRGERNPAAIPHSTYRLQFTPTFRFDDARAIVPYLAELGIGTIYASPYFEARPGSEHGYDVVNPNALNPEIGTAAEHADFIAVAQRAGLGHLLDFVPNHMGIGVVNPRWLDVLAWGEGSPSANFFDINWRPLQREMWGRVLVPSLGDYYNRVLERGELSLEFDPEAGTIAVAYFDDRFPLAPTSYPAVLEIAATLRSGSAWALRALAAEFGSASREEAIALQAGLADAARDAGDRAAIEAALATFRVDADAAAIDRLDALLQAQHYRLAYWRVSADEINYRRFFDVNDLAGVRVEDAEVLGRTHVLVFDLIARGIVQGLRIDHVDGLFNPSGYCRFLRDRGETLDHPQYLLVEKILARDETLHTDWGVDGTTGYDFMAQVAGLFVDGAAEAEFDRIYRRFAGVSGSFAQFAYRAKKDIMQISLASELEVLSTLLYELAQLDRRSKDFTYNVLRDALVEIVASFPVYRTYVTSEDVSPLGRHYIDAALEAGFVRSELGEARVFEFIESLLTVHAPEISPNYPGRDVLRFAMKFQQYTGPVMAKSVEDTAFYRYVRLVALNEVGGDPAFFGTSVAAFHQANAARATDFPHTMLATATHDHKRGEDTRLRIAALSEMPALWGRAIRRWTTLNLRHKSNIDAGLGPSDNDEYFIYQILIGTWPVAWLDATTLDANERDAYVARLTAYFEKALREAKFRTSWFNPSEPYETAVKGFVEAIVPADEPTPFIRELQALARACARIGAVSSLAQLVLKLMSPGMPDTYQGCEFWDLSLVDPDNRRPVDYAARHAAIGTMAARAARGELAPLAAELLASWHDGRVKLFVLWRLLHLRRERAATFRSGGYVPLETEGADGDRLVAFARQDVVIVVPRLVRRVLDDSAVPQVRYSDARVRLHASAAERFVDRLSGRAITVGRDVAGPYLAASDLFGTLPVAVLEPA